MKRFAFLLALIAASTMSVMAQNGNLTIKGSVFDFDSAEPLFPANVQVYELPDSTYINGTSTEIVAPVMSKLLAISPADIRPFFNISKISLLTGSDNALNVSANPMFYLLSCDSVYNKVYPCFFI